MPALSTGQFIKLFFFYFNLIEIHNFINKALLFNLLSIKRFEY